MKDKIIIIIILSLISFNCKENKKVQEQPIQDSLAEINSIQKQKQTDAVNPQNKDDFKLESISSLNVRDINNPLIGVPVSLRQLLFEQPFDIPINEALDMAERGHPFVLLVDENGKKVVYYVFNQKANFLGKELAKFCGKSIKLIGKYISIENINIFYAEKIITD